MKKLFVNTEASSFPFSDSGVEAGSFTGFCLSVSCKSLKTRDSTTNTNKSRFIPARGALVPFRFGPDSKPSNQRRIDFLRSTPIPSRRSPCSGSLGLDSRSSRDESANKRRNHAGMVPADRRLIKFGAARMNK